MGLAIVPRNVVIPWYVAGKQVLRQKWSTATNKFYRYFLIYITTEFFRFNEVENTIKTLWWESAICGAVRENLIYGQIYIFSAYFCLKKGSFVLKYLFTYIQDYFIYYRTITGQTICSIDELMHSSYPCCSAVLWTVIDYED